MFVPKIYIKKKVTHGINKKTADFYEKIKYYFKPAGQHAQWSKPQSSLKGLAEIILDDLVNDFYKKNSSNVRFNLVNIEYEGAAFGLKENLITYHEDAPLSEKEYRTLKEEVLKLYLEGYSAE